MMTRRTFLRTAAVGGVATVAIGVVESRQFAVWLFRRGYAWMEAAVFSPERRLRAHFAYLDLEPAGVEQYFADYARYRPDFSRREPLRDDHCTRYLLSTDFFRHDADEPRSIRYVRFYSPSMNGCGNPLARFDA